LFKENNDIIINLTITPRCYAQCKGCINNYLTFCGDDSLALEDLESDPERDANLVVRIAGRYPHEKISVCFYGGEPFLAPDKMEKIRLLLAESEVRDRVRYMVYTTGEFIGDSLALYPCLVKNIWLYSVSIDGSAKQHESVRPGTSLAGTISSLERLREVYDGNILAWSTLREEQSLIDCFRQFISMHRSGLANHFFWHWADSKLPFEDFKKYSKDYEEELEEVMKQYASWISDGEILPISHINELVLYYMEGKQRGHTACAVELAQNYDILGGRVHACADLPASFGVFGDDGSVEIDTAKLASLTEYKKKLGCGSCGAHWYCGGRCPVQAIVGSVERTDQICRLMRLHVNTVRRHVPYIREMVKKHHISPQRLYDESAFIARYTDVVP
jgi:radical SAM protein with 4Fe4S-binding SPASM domain